MKDEGEDTRGRYKTSRHKTQDTRGEDRGEPRRTGLNIEH